MAKSAPDYYASVSIAGKHNSDLLPVLVDATGQMYAVMTGSEVGVPIKLDGEGYMLARMIGNNGVDLLPVKVDDAGRMISVMTGSVAGVPINVDATGVMVSRMKGYDGANLKDVKVDGAGNMIAVMKGDFGGALETVGLDTNHYIQANITAQALERMHIRTSYGPVTIVDLTHTFVGIGNFDTLDITTKGIIIGGWLGHTPLADHSTCEITITIDGVALPVVSMLTFKNYFRGRKDIFPLFGVIYDPSYGSFELGFTPGFSFETSLKINLNEKIGGCTWGGKLFYSDLS